ncbi:hypothetical protein [Paenibacillus polymyxa]|uniref:hypothetical protein n=1 Tax=Paenibacillus TaxID=44249 RepID=UPI00042E5C5C|nr:hypothetical protein [Paenibacillus polymyxa]AHM68434.1 hypothetical protein PPSQR21_048500 [Paenibacillus polymyxa SQR-21]AIY09154.1 von Willebrand factor A [Paenibacillus polymyxa]
MKWKEPTFGATPMLKALTTANAHRKAQAFDLVAEQKKQKLNYPDWAQSWLRKYKEDWYIAQANGDEVGMRKAQKLAEGLRSKLREMATFPKWAQEQMQKEIVRWMTAEASGDIREKLAAEKAGRAIREKLGLIDTSTKAPPEVPITTESKDEPIKTNVKTPAGKWIPAEFQYNGSSKAEKTFKRRSLKFTKMQWNQEKIHGLWEATKKIQEMYDIQIDPRFLLAIIIQEGTGSFNTSSTNRAADGEHGAETNYAKDLMKANSLIFGKILGYIYYGQEFRKAVVKNNKLSGITGKGNVFQYCNWITPIIRMKSKQVDCGEYASDNHWGEHVQEVYNLFSGNEASNYEQYLLSLDKSVAQKIAASEGIKLPNVNFKPVQNGNDSKKKRNGEWTIVGKR